MHSLAFLVSHDISDVHVFLQQWSGRAATASYIVAEDKMSEAPLGRDNKPT